MEQKVYVDIVAGPDSRPARPGAKPQLRELYRQQKQNRRNAEILLKLAAGDRSSTTRPQRSNYFVDFLVPDGGKVEWNERIRIHSRYLWLQFPASTCAETWG